MCTHSVHRTYMLQGGVFSALGWGRNSNLICSSKRTERSGVTACMEPFWQYRSSLVWQQSPWELGAPCKCSRYGASKENLDVLSVTAIGTLGANSGTGDSRTLEVKHARRKRA